jgi:glc operon protein GlcG
VEVLFYLMHLLRSIILLLVITFNGTYAFFEAASPSRIIPFCDRQAKNSRLMSSNGHSSPSNWDNLLVQPMVQITPAGAARAMAAAEAEAAANGWDVTICISDAGGTPIMVKRKAFAASYDIAVGKSRSAALFGKETAGLEAAVNVVEGASRAALLSAPFVLMRGGVPFLVNGVCCGAVGVSGVQPEQDEQVARAAVAVLTSVTSKL